MANEVDERRGSANGAEGTPPPSPGASRSIAESASVATQQRGERRVYLGGGVWESANGRRLAAPPSAPVPAVTAAARPSLPRRWPLQVLLTLPTLWGGAVAAGLGAYLVGLALTVGDPGLSDLALLLCGVGALLAAFVLVLACGVMLRERPRGRLPLAVLSAAAVGAVAAALLAVLGLPALPALGAAALLGYAAALLALLFAVSAPAARSAVGAATATSERAPSPAVVDGSGRRWVQVGAPVATEESRDARSGGLRGSMPGVPPGASVWIDAPARWSWDAHVERSARSPAWFALGVLGALMLTAAAVAAGFVAYSLFVESFVAGQAELDWQDTLLSTALQESAGGGALGVVVLVLVNLGCAALFGLLAWAAALCVGGWRGRIAWRWGIVLGVLLIAGVVAWLLDASLPRF